MSAVRPAMPVLEASQCEDCQARIKYDVEYSGLPLCDTCSHLRVLSVSAPEIDPWVDPTLSLVLARTVPVTEVPDDAPWMSDSYKKIGWKPGEIIDGVVFDV